MDAVAQAPVLGMRAQVDAGNRRAPRVSRDRPLPFACGASGPTIRLNRFDDIPGRATRRTSRRASTRTRRRMYSVVRAPRPMATNAFTSSLFLRADAPLGDAPLWFRARMLASHAGCCVEQRELLARGRPARRAQPADDGRDQVSDGNGEDAIRPSSPGGARIAATLDAGRRRGREGADRPAHRAARTSPRSSTRTASSSTAVSRSPRSTSGAPPSS